MKKHKKKNKGKNLPKKKHLPDFDFKPLTPDELENRLSLIGKPKIQSMINELTDIVIKSLTDDCDNFRFKLNSDAIYRNIARYVKITLINDVVTVQCIREQSNGLLGETHELNRSLGEEVNPGIETLTPEIVDSVNILKSGCLKMKFIKEASKETGFSKESIIAAFKKFFENLVLKTTSEIERFVHEIEADTVNDFMDTLQPKSQTIEVMESL